MASGGRVIAIYLVKQNMKTSYQSCIDACMACIMACDHCAASCLREKDVTKMTTCIRLDMECADMCRLVVRFMILGSQHASTLCEVCANICQTCAMECENHLMEHCRECAAACRKCAQECMSMAAA